MTSIAAPPLAVVIAGPTCGGKSQLATRIAEQMDWPIQVMDSMKVYRQMSIGTAKPAPELRRGNPFSLVDLVDPWQEFTVVDWLAALSESTSSRQPWLLSGGTSFYLHALLEGIFAGPGTDPQIRQRLSALASELPEGALHRRLAKVDPRAAAEIHPNNAKRIIRALEVFEISGEPITLWHRRRVPILDPRRTVLLGVFRPRDEMHQRIEDRVLRMFEAGWVDEVKQLLANHDPPWSVTARQSIGYQQISQALLDGTDPADQIETIQARTRALVRSQLAWARKLPIEWYSPDQQHLALDRVRKAHAAVVAGDAIADADGSRLALQQQL